MLHTKTTQPKQTDAERSTYVVEEGTDPCNHRQPPPSPPPSNQVASGDVENIENSCTKQLYRREFIVVTFDAIKWRKRWVG